MMARDVHRSTVTAVMALVALLLLAGTGTIAEVSIGGRGSGDRATGVAILEIGGGGGEPLPWPQVRQHVPAEWLLNPEGNERDPADGYPSLGWDPVADRPEVTWSRHDGTDYEVVIATWLGDRWSDPVALTENGEDDLDPELAYAPDGTARVAFHRAGRVYVVRRPPGGSWSVPEQVDEGTEPSVSRTAVERVAFQRATGSGAEKEIVVSRRDEGGAWIPEIVATTTFDGLDGTGDIDVRLHATPGGKVWIDWEDGETSLGWCELSAAGTWSAPGYEPISGSEDEEAGRLRIELRVTR